MSKRYREWKVYIGSPEWEKRRRQHLNTPGCSACWNCGAEDVMRHVHHTTYARLGCEAKDDLITLCHACHEIVHRLQKSGTPLEQCHLVLKQYSLKAEGVEHTVTLSASGHPEGSGPWIVTKIEQFKHDLRIAGPNMSAEARYIARELWKMLAKLQRTC